MATTNLNFAAQVEDWAKETADRMERIWKASTQELGSVANNAVPVDTGFLRASFMASNDAMPEINKSAQNKEGASVSQDFGQITAVIEGATLGQTIYMGWTAAYALRIEYGFNGTDSLGRKYSQPPRGFARLAAAQWPAIVSGVVAQAKARAAS